MIKLFVTAVCLAMAGHALAQPEWPARPRLVEPTAVQLELMRRGEVMVETIRENQKGGAARVQALFRAGAGQIWDVLGDCEANFRFVHGLLECDIEEQSDDHAVTRQVAKKYWLSPPLAYRFETRRSPYAWIQIRLLDGDLKQMSGSWRFDYLGRNDLLLVTHEIGLQPNTPTPRWLVRRVLTRDLSEMIACLRYVSGASLDEAGARSDQAQCPEKREMKGTDQ